LPPPLAVVGLVAVGKSYAINIEAKNLPFEKTAKK
jgi:hypothetical protein